MSEQLIELVAECGIETDDTPYIQRRAARPPAQIAQAARGCAAHRRDQRGRPVRRGLPADPEHQPAAAHDALRRRSPTACSRRCRSACSAISDKVVFCIAADRNGYIADAQPEVQPAAARRPGLGHRQQPLPPHLQRPHRARVGAQPAAVPAADLSPRHGRRQLRRDEGSGRADHRERPPLGRRCGSRSSSERDAGLTFPFGLRYRSPVPPCTTPASPHEQHLAPAGTLELARLLAALLRRRHARYAAPPPHCSLAAALGVGLSFFGRNDLAPRLHRARASRCRSRHRAWPARRPHGPGCCRLRC